MEELALMKKIKFLSDNGVSTELLLIPISHPNAGSSILERNLYNWYTELRFASQDIMMPRDLELCVERNALFFSETC